MKPLLNVDFHGRTDVSETYRLLVTLHNTLIAGERLCSYSPETLSLLGFSSEDDWTAVKGLKLLCQRAHESFVSLGPHATRRQSLVVIDGEAAESYCELVFLLADRVVLAVKDGDAPDLLPKLVRIYAVMPTLNARINEIRRGMHQELDLLAEREPNPSSLATKRSSVEEVRQQLLNFKKRGGRWTSYSKMAKKLVTVHGLGNSSW